MVAEGKDNFIKKNADMIKAGLVPKSRIDNKKTIDDQKMLVGA